MKQRYINMALGPGISTEISSNRRKQPHSEWWVIMMVAGWSPMSTSGLGLYGNCVPLIVVRLRGFPSL